MEPPIKVVRKARLANIFIPKGIGEPLWKIIGGKIDSIKTISGLSVSTHHSSFFFG
jgi:hypothetical protein